MGRAENGRDSWSERQPWVGGGQGLPPGVSCCPMGKPGPFGPQASLQPLGLNQEHRSAALHPGKHPAVPPQPCTSDSQTSRISQRQLRAVRGDKGTPLRGPARGWVRQALQDWSRGA